MGMKALRSLGWYDRPQVELLVLSACETALGDAQAKLGFAGLAVQTGAKSALASLWQVSDVGTCDRSMASWVIRTSPLKPRRYVRHSWDCCGVRLRLKMYWLVWGSDRLSWLVIQNWIFPIPIIGVHLH
ncbi:MAG: CHAT domain-containing protein [Spirulina sp. SIO3F2]|nr:CHAT domain-containing protein [Spirulina sp. SIO3F2]